VRDERDEATDLGLKQSGIFFGSGLDDPNQIEASREISFCAPMIFRVLRPREQFSIIGRVDGMINFNERMCLMKHKSCICTMVNMLWGSRGEREEELNTSR
jgi:hypothetical protein